MSGNLPPAAGKGAPPQPVAARAPALRPLGRSGLALSPIGFGAFKIGRNQKTKYSGAYDLPSDEQVAQLLNGLLDLGINYIDTAPAYGTSEERIGRAISGRRADFVLATKVGETFEAGVSSYDFAAAAIRKSVERSLDRLRTPTIDVLLLHSDGRDEWIQTQTDAVPALQDLKRQGLVRAIGLSGKTVEGSRRALEWADVLMVEYHLRDRSHESLVADSAARGVGIVVKKGLASGQLPAEDAIRFVLDNPHVTSLVVGGLSLDHFRTNLATASSSASPRD